MYVIQCLFTWNCKNMDGLLTTHQDETRPFLWIVPPIQFSQSKSQPATSRNARRPCVLRSGWGSIRRLCPQHKWGIPGRQLHYVPSSKIAQVTQRGLSETKSHGVCSFSLLNLITKVAIVGYSGIPKMDKPKWRTAGVSLMFTSRCPSQCDNQSPKALVFFSWSKYHLRDGEQRDPTSSQYSGSIHYFSPK